MQQPSQQQTAALPSAQPPSAMPAAAPSGASTTGAAAASALAPSSAASPSACAVVCPLTALLRHYLGMLTCSRMTAAPAATTTGAPVAPPAASQTSDGRAAAAAASSASVSSASSVAVESPSPSLRRRPSRDEHAASHSAVASVGPAPAPTAAAPSDSPGSPAASASASSVSALVQQQWASVQAEHSRSSAAGGSGGSAGTVPLSQWMSAVTEADVAWLRAQPCLLQQSHRLREQAAAAAAAAAAQDRLFQVALPIPVARPAPPAVVAVALRGTDLYTSTRAQCGLLDDSLRPASVVQMLRGREMHNPAMMRARGGRHAHGPRGSGTGSGSDGGHGSDCRPACRCGCRSGAGVSLSTSALQVQLQCVCPSAPSSPAPSASASAAPSSATRGGPHGAIPSHCAQVHHYESRVFGAQFDHAGRTLCVATQDRHIRLYAIDGGDGHSDADGERWTRRRDLAGGLSARDSDSESDAAGDAASHVGQRLFDSRPFAGDGTATDDSSSLSSSSLSSSLSSSSRRRPLPSSWDSGRGWPCTLDVAGRDVGWAIVSTAFSPNDQLLAYSTWSPRVHVLSTGRAAGSGGGGGAVHESLDFKSSSHRFCLFSLCFSPCGRSILGGASDRGVYLHSVELNRPLVRLAGAHSDDVNSVTYLDGHFSGGAGDAILTAGDDHVVKLWDLRLLGGAPDAAASSASASTAAAVDGPCARVPRPVSVFAGHSQGITSLSARGDGRHFVTNSKDQSCKLFDVRLPSPAATAAAAASALSAPAAVGARRLPQGSSSGQAEAAARTEAQEAQWDYRWPTHVAKVACQERARQAQLQAQQAAAAKAAEGARKGCAASLAVSACLQALSPAFPATFAAAASSSSCPSSVDAALSSLSVSSGKGADGSSGLSSSSASGTSGAGPVDRRSAADTSLVTFTGHRVLETLIRAYFSPLASTGQRFVYSGSQCGSVFVWDVLTGETVQRLRGHYGTVRDAAWHPRENVLVSASWDCSLARWELPQA